MKLLEKLGFTKKNPLNSGQKATIGIALFAMFYMGMTIGVNRKADITIKTEKEINQEIDKRVAIELDKIKKSKKLVEKFDKDTGKLISREIVERESKEKQKIESNEQVKTNIKEKSEIQVSLPPKRSINLLGGFNVGRPQDGYYVGLQGQAELFKEPFTGTPLNGSVGVLYNFQTGEILFLGVGFSF